MIANSLSEYKEFCLHSIDLTPSPEIERLHFGFSFSEQDAGSTHVGKGPFYSNASIKFKNQTEHELKKSEISLDFDRLMSAFFDKIWFDKTHLESVILKGDFTGEAMITVFRQTTVGDVMVVHRDFVSEEKSTFRFELNKEDLYSPAFGRHWIVVESSEEFGVKSLGWYTTQEPIRDVALGVVLATFNREPFLGRTLQSILSSDQAYDAAAKIFVINQGNSFDLEDLVDVEVHPRLKEKVTLIEQGNFGGAGGFTRGMMEIVEDDDLTHVLLCDDDIVFEHSSLHRTKAFFSYAKDNVAMGGLMMDLLTPNSLYEAGAYIDLKRHTARPHKHQINMAEDGAMSSFLKHEQIDFNGWWFFGFDKKVISKIGYPLPCFIRGDDVEFGKRLNSAGIETVVMPGVIVWHEPFYLKLGGWHYYFEVRNRLIYASLYRQDQTADDLLKPLNKIFMRDMLTCRYYTAKLYLKAVEDFLKGETIALSNDPNLLKEALSLKKEFGPSPLKQDETLPLFAPKRSVPKFKILEIGAYVWTFLTHLLRKPNTQKGVMLVDAPDFNFWNTSNKDSFVIREPDKKSYLRFERDPKIFRELMKENYKVRQDFKRKYESASEDYRRKMPEYTSKEGWKKRMGLSS